MQLSLTYRTSIFMQDNFIASTIMIVESDFDLALFATTFIFQITYFFILAFAMSLEIFNCFDQADDSKIH